MTAQPFCCEMCDAWKEDDDDPRDNISGFCRMFPILEYKTRQGFCVYGRDRHLHLMENSPFYRAMNTPLPERQKDGDK